ncbi:hypothetical protein IKE80_02165 [Candidatus Saccharibacteria bacterium]|nr:hypothetical protein [Candidatus Saccharibacteria bacterium]
MDGQQYLNQISKANKPVKRAGGKKSISNILSSKFFIIGAVAIGLLVIIIIIGAILGGNKDNTKTLSYDLKLHLDNTSEVIQEYQQNVKSSILRSNSASLSGVLANTSRDLTDYLVNKYKFKDKDISKKIVEEATLAKDELTNELFEAKINGILDRIYAHKMAYEISLLTAEEAKLIKASQDDALTELLTTSHESLSNLYDKFNDFSETKN